MQTNADRPDAHGGTWDFTYNDMQPGSQRSMMLVTREWRLETIVPVAVLVVVLLLGAVMAGVFWMRPNIRRGQKPGQTVSA
jgi:hypothetical protein